MNKFYSDQIDPLRPMLDALNMIENTLFAPTKNVYHDPEFDTIIEDVFNGVHGEWRAFWDMGVGDCAPPNDHLVCPTAELKFVELQFPKSLRSPVRFLPEELQDIERAKVQDIIDQELECMG